jgi:hypothetical protein
VQRTRTADPHEPLHDSGIFHLQRAAGNASLATLFGEKDDERSLLPDVGESGRGQPLKESARTGMDTRFGHEKVQAHTVGSGIASKHGGAGVRSPSVVTPASLGANVLVSLQRSVGNKAVIFLLARSPTHPILQRACCDGCARQTDDRKPDENVSTGCVQRKTPGDEYCDSAADEAQAASDEDDEEAAAEETEGMAKAPESVEDDQVVQRYTLKGFPPAEKAKMDTAVPLAASKVTSCKPEKTGVIGAINSKTYEYHGEEDFTNCGWTFPSSWYIKIGKSAFDSSTCCDLESTVAHEASHTQWYTEGKARKLECDCFGCSC